MKFFLDENTPKAVDEYLVSVGHEIYSVRSTKYAGTDDVTLFKLAQEIQAIFITTDKDFFHTVPFHFKNHSGAIVVALKLPNRDNILEKIKWAVNNLDINKFANKIVLLKDNSYSVK